MLVANICLRAIMPADMPCLPYEFRGKWSEEDKTLIETLMQECVPEIVGPMFNNWGFYCQPSGFMARRATWDRGFITASDADDLACQLRKYYQLDD